MGTQDQFVFYSKSADVRPGKGAHEHVDDPAAYRALAGVPHWRKMLSNFDAAPFVWTGSDVLPVPYPPGTAWRTIEHVFQSAKFWTTAPYVAGIFRNVKGTKKRRAFSPEDFREVALRFTLNSGDPLGQGDGQDAQRGRKLLWLEPEELARWAALSQQVMASAARAKYAQNPDRLHMLRATAPAQLLHLVTARGKPSTLVRFHHLEEIRDE